MIEKEAKREASSEDLDENRIAATALQGFLRHQALQQTPAHSYASREQLQEAITTLKRLFPDEGSVVCDPTTLLELGASYAAYLPDVPHAVVVQPLSTADVVKIVETSRKYKVPIVPAGGATALAGHFVGVCNVYCIACVVC